MKERYNATNPQNVGPTFVQQQPQSNRTDDNYFSLRLNYVPSHAKALDSAAL